MKMTSFFRPRITGPRFEGGSIPLEMLADFAVLSEMLLEVARWKFREQNVDRKRIPRGFFSGVSLRLTSIEQGSAIPVIGLVATPATSFSNEVESYFIQARNAVIAAVAAAQEGTRITDHLPEKLLGYFDRFGRNLADGEAIELSDDAGGPIARLTKDSRRKLVRASTAQDYTEETSVYGLVHEFDQRTRTFQLTLPTGATLSRLPAGSQHYDTILEASNGFRQQTRVRIFGLGRFDLNNRLQEMISVEHAVILDRLDVGVRIDEFRTLKEGWFDGKGAAFSSSQLDWLVDAFANHYPDDARLPYLFPTPDGTILAEWSLGEHAVSLEISLESHLADWHVLSISTGDEETQQYDLNSPDCWHAMADRVKAIGGTAE